MAKRKATAKKPGGKPKAARAEDTHREMFPAVVRTLAEVANFCGVALQTVKQWRTDVDPMPGNPGAYNLRDVVQWRFSRMTERSPAAEQLARLDVAKRAGDVKIQNIRIKKMEAEVIEIELVEHFISRLIVENNAMIDELSERMRQLIPSVGAKIVKGDAEDIAANVSRLADEFRRSMADGLEQWANELEGNEDEKSEEH